MSNLIDVWFTVEQLRSIQSALISYTHQYGYKHQYGYVEKEDTEKEKIKSLIEHINHLIENYEPKA